LTQRDDAYSQGLSGIFEVSATDNDLNIVGRYAFTSGMQSETITDDLAEAIEELIPDVIYAPLIAGVGNGDLIIALQRAFPDVVMLGGDGLTYENLLDSSPTLVNTYATTMPAHPSEIETAATFIDAYQAAFNEMPSGPVMTTYDGMRAILTALDSTPQPVTRQGVLRSLKTLDKVEGAQGSWTFTDTGDINVTAIRLVQLAENGWETIDVLR
ncbi:MAG: hypothetical protein AAF125_26295, partial [Chloroflexota bacterium]